MNVQLSSCQENAKDAFKDFLLDRSKNEMVICGSAGTGKSFLVEHLARLALKEQKVQKIINPSAKILPLHFTATTNKAAHVLQRSLGPGYVVNTIHSFLGLRVRNNYKTGRTYLESHRKVRIPAGILFIDEASMVNAELWKAIRQNAKHCKIVFIGDPYQLTPVREKLSPVFNMQNVFELKTIQRQAKDSPIITLAHQYRAMLDNDCFSEWPIILPDNKAIHEVSGPEFQRIVDLEYNQDHDPNDLRILAWSNQKVIDYNKHIRSFYATSDSYVPGENVATNKPVLADENSVLYPADSILKIASIRPNHTESIPGYDVTLVCGVTQFLPENWKKANNLLKHYAKHKDWQQYFAIKNFWLDLRPIHASTVHKSQGSTYKKVFIDLNDIGRNNKWYEVARLAYVGITRASDEVYIYGGLRNRYN
jgi:hypothetical protein